LERELTMPRRARPANPRRMKEAEQTPTPRLLAPLSHWAFVVQLREGTPLTSMQLTGRVEHLSSGQAASSASLSELLTFMETVLTQRSGPPAP
jgi:hypothetical protein